MLRVHVHVYVCPCVCVYVRIYDMNVSDNRDVYTYMCNIKIPEYMIVLINERMYVYMIEYLYMYGMIVRIFVFMIVVCIVYMKGLCDDLRISPFNVLHVCMCVYVFMYIFL